MTVPQSSGSITLIGLPFSLLLASLIVFPLKVSLTIALVFCVWATDAFIKNIAGLDNDSIFADLSYTSFTFVGSYLVASVPLDNTVVVNANALIQFFLIIMCFGAAWVINILVCRSFSGTQGNIRVLLRCLSFFLGAGPAGTILILQFQGIM